MIYHNIYFPARSLLFRDNEVWMVIPARPEQAPVLNTDNL